VNTAIITSATARNVILRSTWLLHGVRTSEGPDDTELATPDIDWHAARATYLGAGGSADSIHRQTTLLICDSNYADCSLAARCFQIGKQHFEGD